MHEITIADFRKLNAVEFLNFEIFEHDQYVISSVSTDSRTIDRGQVFWVLTGENFFWSRFCGRGTGFRSLILRG